MISSKRARALAAVLTLCPAALTLPGHGDTERVSVLTGGGEANERSDAPAISVDGRFVAFQSWATNLDGPDTNISLDVFVHDRLLGTTERVSVSSGGGQGNHNSTDPAISADGRYVAFSSRASNLVPNDTNGQEDVFLHDRSTGTTTRISTGPGGVQADGLSYQVTLAPDGRHAAFSTSATNMRIVTDTNGHFDIYVRDLTTNTNTLVSVSSAGLAANNNSWRPKLSEDGTIVCFDSLASNLAPGDSAGHVDVFVHDLTSGLTTRVSESSSGAQGNSYSQFPAISGDGRFVVFESRATTLVAVDGNGVDDVFLHDRATGETSMVSVDPSGVFGNFWSGEPTISSDGRLIAFRSWASNMVAGDTNGANDVFVRDRLTGTTQRVSVDSAGAQGNNHSHPSVISPNGRFVAFRSDASNLIPVDTNGRGDIFVHDYLGDPVGVTYCTAGTSASGCRAMLDAVGVPSASQASGFRLNAVDVEGNKDGLFFYGVSGRQALPWGNSTSRACVVPPVRRAEFMNGIGTGGACNGGFSYDLNARWAAKPNHNPGAGAVVQAQLWYRDPANPSNRTTSLSNAIEFTVGP